LVELGSCGELHNTNHFDLLWILTTQMITWAALLVLQGVEGGVGEPDGMSLNFLTPLSLFSSLSSNKSPDFILIQSHLNMLQLTHQPAPSLRHTLATRLESSLQNMHTPRPAPEHLDPLAHDMFDSSWAIFDQNSIALALGAGFGNNSHGTGSGVNENGMVIFTAGNGGVVTSEGGVGSGIVGSGSEAFVGGGSGGGEIDADEGQWLGNEHYSDAWQNTLFRLFGNSEIPMSNNEFGPTGT
jgi:hypothetical protein